MIWNDQWSLNNSVVSPWRIVDVPYELENISPIIPCVNSQYLITEFRSKGRSQNNNDKAANYVLEEQNDLDGEPEKATHHYLFRIPAMFVLTNESSPFFRDVFQVKVEFVVVFINLHELEVSECTKKEMKDEQNEEENYHGLECSTFCYRL